MPIITEDRGIAARAAGWRVPGVDPLAPCLSSRGPVPAGRLLPGDLICGPAGAVAPLIAAVPVPGMPRVALSADALGPGLPRHEVRLSSAQPLMVASAALRPLVGVSRGIVVAGDLLHLPGVRALPPGPGVLLVFARFTLADIAGLPVEGLPLDGDGPERLPPTVRAALFSARPELRWLAARAGYLPPAPRLDAREARVAACAPRVPSVPGSARAG